jgi:hypothetical protein
MIIPYYFEHKMSSDLGCIQFLSVGFFLLNRAWLGHNSVSIKTSITKLMINFILT